MNNLTIVLDMDECICDLSEFTRLKVNKDFNKNYPKGFNQNYWWSDYEGINKSYFEEILNEEGLFLNLEPVDGAIDIITKLYEEGFDIHILTCPQINKICFYEKVLWIKKYLPFINIETNFHTTGDKGLFAKGNRLLLDDNITYLNSFQENGGIAVAFNHGWNRDFQGHRVHNWNQFYNLVHLLGKEKGIDVDRFRNYMRGNHNE